MLNDIDEIGLRGAKRKIELFLVWETIEHILKERRRGVSQHNMGDKYKSFAMKF